MNKKQVKKIKKMIVFTLSLLVSINIMFQVFDKIDKFKVNIYKKVEALTSNNEDKVEEINKEGIENKKDDEIEKEEEIRDSLDNSGYLTLEEDINSDDASKVLPETMYKWNFYREDGKKIAYLTF